ncbi:PocR ligand-binding domain-containing protein [Candidatus Magnetomonas plexicatena]|uniref:PocR ligand-binding domain-containing protein n=1 Tax=Candidatus Magnetomonas plexicatena TaxID=2552947 RepID=UPI001C776964|nr:PAS domain S-box protein [Nitrospirales bacterium LBB_01]
MLLSYNTAVIYTLSDIFNVKELQELSASFTRLTGAVTTILDLDGNILTTSGWQQICTDFHRVNHITAVKCMETDTVLASKLQAKEQYNVYRCKNGLVDVAVPIIIDGVHMGNLFTGQFLFEPPNEQFFIKQAEECGFNKEEYLKALSKVPIFNEEYAKMLVDFMLRLAKVIAETGLTKKRILESTVNTLPGIFYTIDTTGKFLMWNKNLETVSGYSYEEISKMNPLNFFTGDDKKTINSAIEEAFETGDVVTEANVHTKNGRDIPYYFTGSVIEIDGVKCLTGLGTDMSEYKAMESNLRDSEEKYRLLFEHENDAIFLCDAETYEFIDSNDAWCNLYGYSREEMKGQRVFILSAEPEKSERIAKTITSLRVPHILHKHKDGTVFSVELSIGSFTHKGRNMFCVISRDITERIRLEETLKQFTVNLEKKVAEEIEKNRMKDQLMYEQSRHMAMGELLVNIAHQWRQPLAAIGLLVQDLRDAYLCNELNEEYINKNITDVMSELVALSNTIDGFKDFYLSNLQKEVLRIKDMIESALSVTTVYFEVKDIAIEKELDEELTINVVPSEFAQVILNILANVRDVFDQRHVSKRIVKIKSYKDTAADKVVITITDNGGGVREDIIGKIFDPYFTTKDKSRGTGLGLYITKLIVEKSMKGTISVRNINGGAEFKIEV